MARTALASSLANRGSSIIASSIVRTTIAVAIVRAITVVPIVWAIIAVIAVVPTVIMDWLNRFLGRGAQSFPRAIDSNDLCLRRREACDEQCQNAGIELPSRFHRSQ